MLISGGRIIIKNNKILTGIIKLQLVLMIVYEGWYLQKYTVIPGLLQILTLTILATTAMLLLKNPECGKNNVVGYWIFFGMYSLVAALIVNADMFYVADCLFTYFGFLAVIYCAGVVSNYTQDYGWFSKTYLLVGLLCACSALFDGFPYRNGQYFVTTMSANNNPNTLGLTMSIGTFVAVFPERPPRLLGWVMRTALLLAFLLVTLNTGSRSSLICELVVIALFIYSRLKNIKGSFAERLIKNTALVLAVFVIIVIAITYFDKGGITASAIQRLVDKFNAKSFTGRTDLYDLAWKMYKENPVFGIGYNCFKTTSGYGYFTHSTYMELLACTGTIGFLLFLSPVLAGTWYGLRAYKHDGGRSATILLLMLISGLFGIVYYNMAFMIVLYIEISRVPKLEV